LFERFYATQFDYIADPVNQHKVLVDEVLRLEQLDSDFNRFAEKIGFPARLEHLNQSKPTAKVIDPFEEENQHIIRKRFAKDFQYFNYTL
jgi:hypothetical protein